MDEHRPSCNSRAPQGLTGGEEVGVGADDEDPGFGGLEGVMLLTAGEDVGRIQWPKTSKIPGQVTEEDVDEDGNGEELSGLGVEGVEDDEDDEELSGQLPRRSKPTGQLIGGADDDGDGDELPGLLVEGVDVGVSVVVDGDEEELPGQLPRRSKPSGQLIGGADDDDDDDELPGLLVEGVDVGVSVVGDEELPELLVGGLQLPRRASKPEQLSGLEEALVEVGVVVGGSVFVGVVLGGDVEGEELGSGEEIRQETKRDDDVLTLGTEDTSHNIAKPAISLLLECEGAASVSGSGAMSSVNRKDQNKNSEKKD